MLVRILHLCVLLVDIVHIVAHWLKHNKAINQTAVAGSVA
ncbi:hypothetical protein MAMP_00497 [Methylophaga aminisulfidivorans MP]|uniref:Uncharacterized protein n=1 Tax=Methylophaga aminisulfidivorans MP TaxID=1026882 RepID=F5T264_9GAMM|nr:hypothetical protein MAMP_00497 [Methylophaga aminisulfidivorans MP]